MLPNIIPALQMNILAFNEVGLSLERNDEHWRTLDSVLFGKAEAHLLLLQEGNLLQSLAVHGVSLGSIFGRQNLN